MVHGLVAEEETDEDRREHRRDDGGAEDRHRERADHDFEHEERRGDRRVVRAGDAGRHAARRQDPDSLRGELQPPRERRGHRGADLDDRSLASLGAARRDDGDRGEDARDRGRMRTVRRPSDTTSIISEMPCVSPAFMNRRIRGLRRSPPRRERRPAAAAAATPRRYHVARVEQEGCEVRASRNGRRSRRAPEQPDGRGEEEELGVRVAPEEAAVPGGAGGGRRLRSGHSSSCLPRSPRPRLPPRRRRSCGRRAFCRRRCPPPRRRRSHRRAFGRSGRAAGRTGSPGCR